MSQGLTGAQDTHPHSLLITHEVPTETYYTSFLIRFFMGTRVNIVHLYYCTYYCTLCIIIIVNYPSGIYQAFSKHLWNNERIDEDSETPLPWHLWELNMETLQQVWGRWQTDTVFKLLLPSHQLWLPCHSQQHPEWQPGHGTLLSDLLRMVPSHLHTQKMHFQHKSPEIKLLK